MKKYNYWSAYRCLYLRWFCAYISVFACSVVPLESFGVVLGSGHCKAAHKKVLRKRQSGPTSWGSLGSLIPTLISSSVRRRKEPGNIGGFKPLTSSGSDRAPPIRLQNEIMWMRAKISQSKATRSYRNVNPLTSTRMRRNRSHSYKRS